MALVIAICVAALPSCISDKNSRLEYGETGLPKNCRAIIAENIAAWRNRTYRPDQVLESIDRNCGANGYSW